MISGILKAGLQGILAGVSRAGDNAVRVVQSFSPESTEDTVDALIALKSDERQVEASAKVIKVGDELSKTLLEIV